MTFVDVKRLAAVDMWGTAGTQRRRRLVLAEFIVGAVGCTALGLLALTAGDVLMSLVGIWLVGAGINYVPLALQAHALSAPGALEEEVRGVDLPHEVCQADAQQLWIAVPLAVAVSALVDVTSRRRH